APMNPTPVATPAITLPSFANPTATTENAAAPRPSNAKVRGPAGLPRISRSSPTRKPRPVATAMRRIASPSLTLARMGDKYRPMSSPYRSSCSFAPAPSHPRVSLRRTMSQHRLDLFGADDADAQPEARTYSVGELTAGVGDAVRAVFADQVWVKG